jgi:hypothetical protein
VWPLPDRLQDTPPVRPLRDTSLAGGVSLIGLVPNLGVNNLKYTCPIQMEMDIKFNYLISKTISIRFHKILNC